MRIFLFLISLLLSFPLLANEQDKKIDCEVTAKNTIEIGECLREKYDVLERQRQKLEIRRVEKEKNEPMVYKDEAGIVDSANRARYLFELYRQFECLEQRPQLGTAASIIQISCEINLTKQRNEMLKRLLND